MKMVAPTNPPAGPSKPESSADSAGQPAPAPPIDLDADPFGMAEGEGENVAGLGRVFRPMLKWLLRETDTDTAEDAAKSTADARCGPTRRT